MNQRIELRAIVRDGDRFLMVRPPGGPWELPGGVFEEDADDVDAAMDSLLRGFGIVTPNAAEDFLRTDHYREGGPPVLVNLYVPTAWEGAAMAPPGWDTRWFELGELAGEAVDGPSQNSLHLAFGLVEPPEVELPAEVLRPAPTAGDRRFAGLDVLRTLSATADPVAAFEAMSRRTPELAADIVDFALGEVWSRPALDRRTRSLQVVAMLAALGGRAGPLRSHINGALNHGATAEQVVETMRMVAVYAGFPAALEAWSIMEEVFATRGIPRPGRDPA